MNVTLILLDSEGRGTVIFWLKETAIKRIRYFKVMQHKKERGSYLLLLLVHVVRVLFSFWIFWKMYTKRIKWICGRIIKICDEDNNLATRNLSNDAMKTLVFSWNTTCLYDCIVLFPSLTAYSINVTTKNSRPQFPTEEMLSKCDFPLLKSCRAVDHPTWSVTNAFPTSGSIMSTRNIVCL